MVKAEIGFNQSSGTGMDLEIQTLLSNKQKWLSSKWDWPFLQTKFNVGVGNGARYVNVPNLNWERPVLVEVKWTEIWQDVDYGIGSEEYNYLDSDEGQQQDPVLRWTFAGQLEIPSPTVAATATPNGTAGSLTGGNYSYVVTFVTAFGETSQGPISNTALGVLNQSMQLTNIPLGPTGVVEGVAIPETIARRIYRTTAGGTAYNLVTTLNDNTTTSFLDGVADANLGVAVPIYSNALSSVMEIWPLPVSLQDMRFTGQRLLNPLIAATDCADLDDMLLVLYVAAELCRKRKSADADLKLQEAQTQLASVRSNYPRRTRRVSLAGKPDGEYKKIVPMTIIAVHG